MSGTNRRRPQGSDADPTVVMANVSDYYGPLVDRLEGNTASGWRRSCARASSYAPLWSGDHKLVIVPEPLNPRLVEDVRIALNRTRVHVIIDPALSSAGDGWVSDETRNIVRSWLSGGGTLRAWAPTLRLRAFSDAVRKSCAGTRVEFGCRRAVWVTGYLDSKVGFRDFVTRSPGLQDVVNLPSGMVCSDLEQGLRVIKAHIAVDRRMVLKGDQGASGDGNAFFTDRSFLRARSNHHRVISRFYPLLSLGPVVAEECIGAYPQRRQTLSVCAVVEGDGSVGVVGHAATITDSRGRHLAATAGVGALRPSLEEWLDVAARAIGDAAGALGFAGPFGFDAVVAEDGTAYGLEVNPRRTLVTHVYDVARSLFGGSWSRQAGLFSAEDIVLDSSRWSYSKVRESLRPIWLGEVDTAQGVLVSSFFAPAGDRKVELGVIAVAADVGAATELCAEARARLGLETEER